VDFNTLALPVSLSFYNKKYVNQLETGKAFDFYVTKGTMAGRHPVQ
jgi:hypothetical protein